VSDLLVLDEVGAEGREEDEKDLIPGFG